MLWQWAPWKLSTVLIIVQTVLMIALCARSVLAWLLLSPVLSGTVCHRGTATKVLSQHSTGEVDAVLWL